MSPAISDEITAVATAVLAAFAIVTAVVAGLAFRKQAQELRDQAALLEVQSGQLETQRQQLADQQALSARQTGVLELQATELRESLDERKHQADEQRMAQADQVAAWFGTGEVYPDVAFGQQPRPAWGAFIRNESPLPIYSARVLFHFVATDSPVSEQWQPIMRGGPPEYIRVIPPRSQKFIEIPDQVRDMIDDCNDNIYVVSVEFTDAAGSRWQRDARGALNSL